jgi:hypothetical protein
LSEVVATATTELIADSSKLIAGLHDSETAVKQSAQSGEKYYAESGKKAGGLFGTAVTGGLKVLGVGASLAFGIATKGALELEDQVAAFRAETGASAAEAERAGKAINGMSSRNIQPMKEIGQALINVHTQMGLTGDEAERTTQDFLTFGRATRQDASTAVSAFDNILDAWGLTAKDANGIMDQLVKSHQRFGGSVTENQAALTAIAPALKAMNLTVDDGVGLLNLFASSGLDASTAQRALNTAVQNMPPGENFKTVVTRLAGIADPAQRATEAVKIFGARAGVGLANAIKPGMVGLDSFIITAVQAAGASRTAADAMDSSFGAQAQLMFKRFGSALTDLGTKFGPLLSGLAGVASLAGTLGIDKLARTLGPAFIGAFKELGAKSAAAVASGFDAVVSGAQGTVIGNLIADAIKRGIPRYRIAGQLVVGAVLGAMDVAWSAVSPVAGFLVREFMAIPGMGAVRAAVVGGASQIGILWGSTSGTAAGVAFRVAFVVALAQVAQAAKNELDKVKLFGDHPPLEGLNESLAHLNWPFGPANPPDWAVAAGFASAGASQVGAAGAKALSDGFRGAGDFIHKALDVVAVEMAKSKSVVGNLASDEGGLIEHGISHGVIGAVTATNTGNANIISSFTRMQTQLGQVASGAADAIYDPIIKANELAQTKLDIAEANRVIKDHKSTDDQVREARFRRDELNKQLFLQLSDLTNYGTQAQQVAAIKAALASKEVAAAYRNGTPEQRAAIDQWRTALNDKLGQLQTAATTGGKATGDNFSDGLKAKTGTARKAGEAVAGAAGSPLDGLGGKAHGWGSDVGANFESGLAAWIAAVGRAAQDIAGAVWKWLHSSIPERQSPLYDVYYSGGHVVRGFADSMLREGGYLARAASTVAATAGMSLVPNLAVSGAYGRSVGPVAGTTIYGGPISAPITVVLPSGFRGGPGEIATLADQLANHLRLSMTPRAF